MATRPRSEAQRRAMFANMAERVGRIGKRISSAERGDIAKATAGAAVAAGVAGAALYMGTRKGVPAALRRHAVKVALGAGAASVGALGTSIERIRDAIRESPVGRGAKLLGQGVSTTAAYGEAKARQAGRAIKEATTTLQGAESLGEWAINQGITLAEGAVEAKLLDHTRRLRQNLAKAFHGTQRSLTEEMIRGVEATRGKLTKGKIRPELQIEIERTHAQIRQNMDALENLKELRRAENKSIRSAALEAFSLMKMKSGGTVRMSQGYVDPDILEQVAAKYPKAKLDDPMNRLKLAQLSSITAIYGSLAE